VPALLAILVSTVVLATAPSPVVPASCLASSAKVRPASIVIACGDGNFYFSKLSWTSWTATQAAGRGLANLNDCTPTCAAGRFHTYRTTVTLTRPRRCHGKPQFGSIRWRYTTEKPARVSRVGTFQLACIP
jgi:hypothetical protein